MQISSLKRQAKDSLDGFWFRTIGIGILGSIIQFIVQSCLSVLAGTVTNEGVIFNPDKLDLASSIIVIIFSALFNMVMSYGMTVYYIRLTRNEDPGVKELFYYFTSGRKSIKVIITQILVAIFTCLWGLLLIVPGIIKGFSYMLTPYIIYDDPKLRPLEAITLSRKMMDGYKWKAFLIALSFIGWFILVVFTLGLAALFVSPYLTTTYAEFYNEVKNAYENKE